MQVAGINIRLRQYPIRCVEHFGMKENSWIPELLCCGMSNMPKQGMTLKPHGHNDVGRVTFYVFWNGKKKKNMQKHNRKSTSSMNMMIVMVMTMEKIVVTDCSLAE